MRCDQCCKFVPFDVDVDPEEQEVRVEDGSLVAEYRRVLNCEECGQEMKEATIEIEAELFDADEPKVSVEAGAPDTEDLCTGGGGHDDFSFDLNAEATADIGHRYKKTMYGVLVTGTITCGKCEKVWEVDASGEEQASGFEELI